MRSDFVIVGGGVHGCALAWELARRGASVTLLEALEIASGASGGFGKRGVRASLRDPRELPLARLANEMWPALADELGADLGYERVGHLHLFESAGARDNARASAAVQTSGGIASRVLEEDELRELEPDLSAVVTGAIHCPDDGVASHEATTHAYAAAARRAGAHLREGVRVSAVESGGAIVEGGERVEARRDVVVLANAATADLVPSLRVFPVLPQALVTPPVARPRVRHLLGHVERRIAMKRLPAGEVMVTGGWLGRWNVAESRGETVPESVTANLAEAERLFPSLAGTIVDAFADRVEGVGPELVPIIDRVPGAQRLVVGAGWTGHGFAIAPAVARLLATWLLDGSRPDELAALGWG